MNSVEMIDIVKQYPHVKAVDHVSFSLSQGEIHSLLGENGAGKSTLMKILYGMTAMDEGSIRIDGKEVKIKSPKDAIDLGIGMVHQHFMLSPVMSVMENIIVNNEPKKGWFVDGKKAKEEVQELIDRFNFNINAEAKVQDLSVGEQQRVEILKAIYRGVSILILDEPTAVLTPQEVEELFVIMRKLKENNKSIVIITHKLKETLAIADKISVLRDGKMVQSNLPLGNVTVHDLANLMVGREVELNVRRENKNMGDIYFEMKDVCLKEKGIEILKDINLSIHAGEILGIAGIEGNGQTELIEVLTGLKKPTQGRFYKGSEEINGDAGKFIKNKVGHIPEDRHLRGLVVDLSIEDNLILGYHDKEEFMKHGLMKRKNIATFSNKAIQDYMIKTPTKNEMVGSLSGGNQQKVVIARVFEQNPDVLIVAQPTRGVDVGATEYIHQQLLKLRDEGKSILLISADLDEVRSLSDRIAVIYDGKIISVNKADEIDELQLGLYMTGGKDGASNE
ncbi:ABC transporter ATP-binding protein [Anaerorhabdus sp.]|jgi:general nucleoside transport system ATP-binding protein|uniref:ABC transporter ATP-binding protein n=1 Tax=Anaerorhabdus sp. TaxID=1872524 RepID=UPI002B1F8DEE|nr:ABC transporter ATP-binding protein [Anaerorhabdus sp.]MEA4875464.1 ABC transporter ATP-binding protein [Anaerorhabdus sp.]